MAENAQPIRFLTSYFDAGSDARQTPVPSDSEVASVVRHPVEVRDEWNHFDRPWADEFQEKWIAAVADRAPERSLDLADLLGTVGSICHGRVKLFLPEQGWGGIESAESPFDVWVVFSVIDGSGYRQLVEGQEVEFRWEPALQDSWLCTATWVRALSAGSETEP